MSNSGSFPSSEYYILAQPTGSYSDMWIQFFVKPAATKGVTLEKYRVEGEDDVLLPDGVSTPETVQYILEKAKASTEDALEKGAVKVNLKLSEFQARILSKLSAESSQQKPASTAGGSFQEKMAQLISLQSRQAQQQEEFLRIMIQSMAPQPRFEAVKPDSFDGTSASPQAWIDFYEYACAKNRWSTDEDKIKNLRLFLTQMAKSWYELRILSHAEDSWDKWRRSFLDSFQECAVDRWDRAIRFTYQTGSALEYFFEKRRLLQMADDALPESSIIPLVVHGMPKDLQKQVQVRSPNSVEDLHRCCKELCVERSLTAEKSPSTAPQAPFQDRRFVAQPSWRQHRQGFGIGHDRTTRPVNQIGECSTEGAITEGAVAKNE